MRTVAPIERARIGALLQVAVVNLERQNIVNVAAQHRIQFAGRLVNYVDRIVVLVCIRALG